jgi:very-short-patch-repair endonuclease
MLSHQTAAELWKLADEPSSLIHVTVPGERRLVRRPGVVLHMSARASLAIHPAATPPRTRIEDTVIDLWETARTLDDAVGWVTRAIGRRRTTADKVRAAADSRSKLRWRSSLAELLDADGVHSVLEFRYVRDVERAHRLPAATRQLRAQSGGRSIYRDEVYEAYQTVVELDGRLAHPGDSRWQDIRRDNAAATTGLATLRYGWQHITTTPCQVAAEIAEVLALRGYAGARPCSAACQVGRRTA